MFGVYFLNFSVMIIYPLIHFSGFYPIRRQKKSRAFKIYPKTIHQIIKLKLSVGVGQQAVG
jgi:hypothetical protein